MWQKVLNLQILQRASEFCGNQTLSQVLRSDKTFTVKMYVNIVETSKKGTKPGNYTILLGKYLAGFLLHDSKRCSIILNGAVTMQTRLIYKYEYIREKKPLMSN